MTGEQLKKSILQYAIEGKLVPQYSSEEPASELIDRIKKEKKRLIEEKIIKNDKKESTIYRKNGSFYEKIGRNETCIDDEIPFEIPDTWEWARLGTLIIHTKNLDIQKKLPSDYNINYIDIASIDNIHHCIREIKINPVSKLSSRARRIVEKGHILYSSVRPYLNNIAIMNDNLEDCIASSGFFVFKSILIEKKYIFYFLLAPYISDYYKSKMNSFNSPSISNIIFNETLIPIPPLEEQHRIIERTEQLLPLVEQYGQAEIELKELNSKLPDKLRKSILQYAIEGKVVPQIATEEPAKALLQRIALEKKRLIAEKVIKKDKSDSTIYRKDGSFYEKIGRTEACIDDEIPFEIPGTWEWARLGFVCQYAQRGKSPKYSPIRKYPVIAQKCNQWAGFSIELAKFIDPDTLPSYAEERYIQDRDILMNSTGLGTVGRTVIYHSNLNPYELAVADSHVSVIRLFKDKVLPEYIYCYLASNLIQGNIENITAGSTKQKELLINTIKNFLIPIPPLEEQHRIVEKVELILGEVDKLKNSTL